MVSLVPLLLGAVVAVPQPRLLEKYELAWWLPKAADAAPFVPFLDEASQYSSLFNRQGFRSEVHPLLSFDVTQADSLAEVGIDSGGSATLFYVGELRYACVQLKDKKRYQERCDARLKTLGELVREKIPGGEWVGAKEPVLGKFRAGYAVKGNQSCAVGGRSQNLEAELKGLSALLDAKPLPKVTKALMGLEGKAFLLLPQGAMGLSSEKLTLTLDGRGVGLRLGRLEGPGPTPFSGALPTSLLLARMRLGAEDLRAQVQYFAPRFAQLCAGCEPSVFKEVQAQLSPHLTGKLAVVTTRVKVTGTLTTPSGRFFAPKTAVWLETSSPKDARAALDGLKKLRQARALADGTGYSLLLKDGEAQLGVFGDHVFVTNEAATLNQSRAVRAAGKQTHGLEWSLDGPLTAQGLSQVPMLDVLQTPELAGVLAAGAELGPLLLHTEKLEGWADTDKSGQRVHGTWSLKQKAVLLPDGGVSDAGR